MKYLPYNIGKEEHFINKERYGFCFIFIVFIFIYLFIFFFCNNITKTRLFKYIENFTTKNWKFSDKNCYCHISAKNIIVGTR